MVEAKSMEITKYKLFESWENFKERFNLPKTLEL